MTYNSTTRKIMLYQIFISNLSLSRTDLMRLFGISSRTLDRDIAEIRNSLSEMSTFTYQLPLRNLTYDSNEQKYILYEEETYGD